MAELAAARSPRPMQACLLGPADAADIARLTAGRRYTADVLAGELADFASYRWAGVRGDDGRLVAAHRALRWGGYLFLKGVFVDPAARGGDGAPRLAFFLRDLARREAMPGIAAWVSESSPAQLALARRLRLERTGPPLHLYTLPFAGFLGDRADRTSCAPAEAAGRIESVLARRHAELSARVVLADLLKKPDPGVTSAGLAARRALPDRNRLLLSSLPCTGPDDLCALLAELAPAARALGLDEAELCVPAADIPFALWLTSRKAPRVSPRPVYVGLLDSIYPTQEVS